MASTAAYLRRSLALLEWINAKHPEATVTLGPAELGGWCDLSPRWRLDGARIRLQVHGAERNLACWARSVRPAPWGASIDVWNSGGPQQEMRVIWMQSPADLQPTRRRLLNSARAWLRLQLPGCRILSAGQACDRAHTLSGNYLRVRLQHGGADHLLLACGEECDEEQAYALLTQALLWLAYLRERHQINGAPWIHLLVPAGRAAVLSHRSRLVNPTCARISVREYVGDNSGHWTAREPAPQAVPVEDRDYRWPVLGPFRWSPLLARVLDLAPEAIQRYPGFRIMTLCACWVWSLRERSALNEIASASVSERCKQSLRKRILKVCVPLSTRSSIIAVRTARQPTIFTIDCRRSDGWNACC